MNLPRTPLIEVSLVCQSGIQCPPWKTESCTAKFLDGPKCYNVPVELRETQIWKFTREGIFSHFQPQIWKSNSSSGRALWRRKARILRTYHLSTQNTSNLARTQQFTLYTLSNAIWTIYSTSVWRIEETCENVSNLGRDDHAYGLRFHSTTLDFNVNEPLIAHEAVVRPMSTKSETCHDMLDDCTRFGKSRHDSADKGETSEKGLPVNVRVVWRLLDGRRRLLCLLYHQLNLALLLALAEMTLSHSFVLQNPRIWPDDEAFY